MNNYCFVFTTLAMNQTVFFVGLAKELIDRGCEVHIVSFHEDSCAYIERNGIACHNMFDYIFEGDVDDEFIKICKRLNIKHPGILLSHEKYAFNLRETKAVKKKYCRYVTKFDEILSGISQGANRGIRVVQELGGFSSLVSCYYVALARGVEHLFIEPSFFRGRVFFVKDSLSSINIVYEDGCVEVPDELSEYLQESMSEKRIVIPVKDRAGYRNPLFKILNAHNIMRFFQKMFSKVVRRREEEFSYVYNHVRRHVRMFVNNVRLRRFYSDIPSGKLVYFPMHVPNDVALTVRSPEYYDQLSLIEMLARFLPMGVKLAIKEHPAMVGELNRRRMMDLLKMHDNITLLNPGINNYDVLNAASLVVTINSKAGAEAVLMKKKVIVLGDAFYDESPLVLKVDRVRYLPELLEKLLGAGDESGFDDNRVHAYFSAVWKYSYVGELYSDCPENYKKFSDSLLSSVATGSNV